MKINVICTCVCLVPEVVNAVLGGSLPHRAPWDRAPPQLTQSQMKVHDMTGQARVDVHTTIKSDFQA